MRKLKEQRVDVRRGSHLAVLQCVSEHFWTSNSKINRLKNSRLQVYYYSKSFWSCSQFPQVWTPKPSPWAGRKLAWVDRHNPRTTKKEVCHGLKSCSNTRHTDQSSKCYVTIGWEAAVQEKKRNSKSDTLRLWVITDKKNVFWGNIFRWEAVWPQWPEVHLEEEVSHSTPRSLYELLHGGSAAPCSEVIMPPV